MTSRDFCYWLQGYFEMADVDYNQKPKLELNPSQVEMLRNHLKMVFAHEIDPSHGSKDLQASLSKLHLGGIDLSGDLSAKTNAYRGGV